MLKHCVVVSPKQGYKYGISFICLYYAVGKDLEGKALWVRRDSTPLGLKRTKQSPKFGDFIIRQVPRSGQIFGYQVIGKIHLGVQTGEQLAWRTG